MSGSLEISGAPDALLDEPLDLSARGLGDGEAVWRARLRDDDGRVWKGSAERPAGLLAAMRPAKPTEAGVPALLSLRPVALDVRVEAADGRSAGRTLTRRLLTPAVRVRRWRDVGATLFLAEAKDRIALVERDDDAARLAAALLASRGVTALVVGAPNDEARERLAAMSTEVVTIEPVLPPGVPSVADDDDERAAAWSALIATFSPDG